MNSTMNQAMHSTNHVIDDIKEHAADAAKHPRAALVHYGLLGLKLLTAARALEMKPFDGLLREVGLERRSARTSPIFLLAVGAAVGGGLAFAFAPTSGRQLRRRVARWIDAEMDEVEGDVLDLKKGVADHIEAAKKPTIGKPSDIHARS